MAKIGFRVWILIISLFLALLMISPSFKSGVVITSVEKNSTAFNEGLRQGMLIETLNSQEIKNLEDYTREITKIFNEENASKKVIIGTDQGQIILFTKEAPEITVKDKPKTKIKTGLDLSGGARALLKPVNVSLDNEKTNDLIAVLSERLNIYGLKDVTVRPSKDLQGNNFILVEIAGAPPSDLQLLLGQQGKFEAKVGNTSVFVGGKEDIGDVCRNDASCAGITECLPAEGGGFACNFRFILYLTEKAAQRHADVTENLSLDESGNYLSEKLYLYIDDNEVDSLLIGASLKGEVTTQISIQGSGTGNNQEDAYKDAQASMQRLQTVLITGSLPYKLEIVKLDTISPLLGKEFTKALILLAAVVFAIVSLAILVKYRKIKVVLSVIMTMFSEAFITLGIASLIGWNLDAPSIAGIIAGMGTGVNDQIVILDESVSNKHLSMKERIKSALFIILGAFLTIVAAMIPLFWAGAGMLKGFALTTIIGVTVGILITRPAFAEIIRKMDGN